MKKASIYIVRPNHFGGWVTESPRGSMVQHPTKEAAEKYAWSRAEKIEWRMAHGGKRQGAGRPQTGHSVITRSVSMPPETWDKLDAIRGDQSRGQWIADRVRRAR